MAFIRNKTIEDKKGNKFGPYYYLVESVRDDEGKVKQKNLKYLGADLAYAKAEAARYKEGVALEEIAKDVPQKERGKGGAGEKGEEVIVVPKVEPTPILPPEEPVIQEPVIPKEEPTPLEPEEPKTAKEKIQEILDEKYPVGGKKAFYTTHYDRRGSSEPWTAIHPVFPEGATPTQEEKVSQCKSLVRLFNKNGYHASVVAADDPVPFVSVRESTPEHPYHLPVSKKEKDATPHVFTAETLGEMPEHLERGEDFFIIRECRNFKVMVTTSDFDAERAKSRLNSELEMIRKFPNYDNEWSGKDAYIVVAKSKDSAKALAEQYEKFGARSKSARPKKRRDEVFDAVSALPNDDKADVTFYGNNIGWQFSKSKSGEKTRESKVWGVREMTPKEILEHNSQYMKMDSDKKYHFILDPEKHPKIGVAQFTLPNGSLDEDGMTSDSHRWVKVAGSDGRSWYSYEHLKDEDVEKTISQNKQGVPERQPDEHGIKAGDRIMTISSIGEHEYRDDSYVYEVRPDGYVIGQRVSEGFYGEGKYGTVVDHVVTKDKVVSVNGVPVTDKLQSYFSSKGTEGWEPERRSKANSVMDRINGTSKSPMRCTVYEADEMARYAKDLPIQWTELRGEMTPAERKAKFEALQKAEWHKEYEKKRAIEREKEQPS